MSLSDFIAPRESGVPDYLGLFANACFGLDKLVQPFKDSVSVGWTDGRRFHNFGFCAVRWTLWL